MTEFVNKEYAKWTESRDMNASAELILSINNYANFLKQSVKLSMFIAVDQENNVLEKNCEVFDEKCRDCSCREYEKAKNRIYFKDFEIYKHIYDDVIAITNGVHKFYFNADGYFYDDKKDNKNITSVEKLIKYNLDLQFFPEAIA